MSVAAMDSGRRATFKSAKVTRVLPDSHRHTG